MNEIEITAKKEKLIFYYNSPFLSLLDIQDASLFVGHAEFYMPITEKHTNPYGNAHGGSLMSLLDTAMGVACSTLGKKVVTSNMNTSFVRSANVYSRVKGTGKVIHNGKQTMVVEGEVVDENGRLLAKATGTFFVVGVLETVPPSL